MRTIQLLLLVFLSTALCFGQMKDERGYTKEDYQFKTEKFINLRNAGLVMLGLGLTSIGTGIGLASNADWETHTTSTGVTKTTNDPAGGAGIILIASGIPVTITGIVLSAIGSRKYKDYKYRLNLYSTYNPNKKCLQTGIVYNF